MATLLVIDDEPSILYAFRHNFREPAYTVLTASSAAEATALIASRLPDAIVLDVHLPDATGLQTFEQIRRIDARIPVILITGHGTTDLAIEAMKRGAYEYLVKPLELPQLRELVTRACASSRLMTVPALMDDEPPQDQGDLLVGQCSAMQEVYKGIGRVASQDVNVLVRGESGTGKELVARAIYQHSKRANKPFLAINCAAIPEALLESELFGHEKGAFTGADRKRIGKFEQCTGGTLFLDEVGDMTPLTQTKILRVLQDQTFERVGGNETVKTDVRLIAATNADLEKLVSSGRFRGDLYFRLNVFAIKLPPLRERGGDLKLLADYYVKRFGRELGRTVQALPDETVEVLQHYHWPGNVRELQSVLQTALLQMSGTVLLPQFLPGAVTQELSSSVADSSGEEKSNWDQFVTDRLQAGSEDLYAEALEVMERAILKRVIDHCEGNQVQAARILGITRTTLRSKLRALKLTIERFVCPEDDQPE